jgi:hypothetical protein
MRWRCLLFIHWPVPVEAVRPLVPPGLEVDTFDSQAWVGLIPFTMDGIRAALLPPVPTTTAFHECNVRTYVRLGEERGVWFFSLDAASRLAVLVARRLWRLNYVHSRMSLERDGDLVRYRVERRGEPGTGLRCAWRVGEALARSQPGELAHFLTERYVLYSSRWRPDGRAGGAGGRRKTARQDAALYRGHIDHAPWPLRAAALLELEDGLVAAAGIDLGGAPAAAVHAADRLEVEAWRIERVDDGPRADTRRD